MFNFHIFSSVMLVHIMGLFTWLINKQKYSNNISTEKKKQKKTKDNQEVNNQQPTTMSEACLHLYTYR